MGISEIVQVNITRETAGVSQAGFGTLLFVGESHKLPAVDVSTIVLAADLVTGNSVVVTINDVALSAIDFASDHATTMAAIAIAIQAVTGVDTAVAGGTGTRTIAVTADADARIIINSVVITGGASQAAVTITRIPAVRLRFYASADDVLDDFASTDPEYLAAVKYFSAATPPEQIAIGAKRTGDATWTDTLAAIKLENNDWYGLAISSRTQAHQELAAAWAETNEKLCGFSSALSGILTSGTIDLAAVLSAAEYERSFVIFHENSDGSTADDWPEVAWFGKMLPKDPGSATWKFKTLVGVTASSLNTTQVNYAKGKNCNLYREIGGVSITAEGVVASGEFIDIIIGTDWLIARIAESIYAKLVNADKIPFTDSGAAILEGIVKARLRDAVDVDLLRSDPKPETSVPLVSAVSTANRTARTLPDVNFTAQYAGAVHRTTINGTISI